MNTEWVWKNKKLFFDSCLDLVSIQDKNYIIRKVNKAYADVFGMKPEEAVGKACYELVHRTKEPIAKCPHRRTLETKKPVRERFFEPNLGAYLNVRTEPIFDKKGKIHGTIHTMKDICECIRTRKDLQAEREALKKSEAKLKEQKASLEQKNAALREILEQIGIEKNRIKEDVITNIEKVVLPIVEKLRIKRDSRKYVSLLQKSLEGLTSSFGKKLTEKKATMTPREIEISNMIKNGFISKEISGLLNISLRTAERHRFNIRKKLRIAKKDVNLASFLQQL